MFSYKSKLVSLAAVLFGASFAFAQDSKALIDVLIQKGILNKEEAASIQKDLVKQNAATEVSTSGSKYLGKLTLSGRFQVQYAGLSTDISGTTADPAATNHFFMRRMYLGAKADMGAGWSATLNYDFAGTTFDAAFIEYKYSDMAVLDAGFRKVPIGLEEWYTSSGNLRAMERSPATRFFVESNNGRRLGAGSYRVGLYLGGKDTSGFFYNLALTNPERNEDATAGVNSAGNNTNNNLSYWANAGYVAKIEGGSLTLSASYGFLPDQGGKTLGAGNDLSVYNAFAEYTRGPVDLQVEYFGSNNDRGASATADSSSSAWSIQPAYRVGDIEGVFRYSYVDSDGRGLSTSDLIRSAPSGGTMDKLSEYFAGLNFYLRGNDVKWQIGYIHGESKNTVTGGNAKATTDGVRSMMQVNF
ncbi:MAG TPA: porin [Lacunisphaera sp.]|nr:porin [Lacunisphaera sp.]